MSQSSSQSKNRLASEKSPYLLQHAGNPVDWYPWGEEAFKKAKDENKLIFLSIGYSTCHWCHVMERESFENQEIADLLNKDFVSIKVDREERPDVDHIYMTVVQAMTGSGGWPLTVFLTPEAKPVTGGTYFPPEDRWGRAGMKSILPRILKLWQDNPDLADKASEQLNAVFEGRTRAAETDLTEEVFTKAFSQFSSNFDPLYGGFGNAPKFPRTHDLSFLLRYWKRTQDPHALEMVEKTLDEMARGGMYDQLGGGFHRYSTDAQWLVPHFEKMLYDQALLAQTYTEAYQATRKEKYADVVADIFRYLFRDMVGAEGGFYSAEDADSEGEEGKFFVWRPEEITQVLGEETGKLFNEYYGVTDKGNFEHATSILHIQQPLEAFAQARDLKIDELSQKFKEAREKLFQVRKKRIHPYKDDKILTSWNGLMISALAGASRVFKDDAYATRAERSAEFILKKMTQKGRLLRRYRQGDSAILGFHDDYAFFALGLLDLYQATFNVRWLEEAMRLNQEMIRLFWDEEKGGFFFTASDSEKLITRPKEYYDGAIPSGNSVAALLMSQLSRMTGDSELEGKVEKLIQSNGVSFMQHPMAYPQLAIAFDFVLGPSREIVIAGDPSTDDFKAMMEILEKSFEPRDILLHHPTDKSAKKIQSLVEFIAKQPSIDGKTTVYVCRGRQCEFPVTTPTDLEKTLAKTKS